MSDDLTPEEVESVADAMGDSADETAVATEEAPEQTTSEEQPAPAAEAPRPADVETETHVAGGGISQAQFMQLEELASAANLPPQDLQRMHDVKVEVEVRLGNARMPLEEILKLQTGSIVELDRLAGEPVDLYANDKLIARAEVVVVEDQFGVKILDIVGTAEKLTSTEK